MVRGLCGQESALEGELCGRGTVWTGNCLNEEPHGQVYCMEGRRHMWDDGFGSML
ncbi:hypothetical protein LK536_13815 [Lachnoclostridium pacaense]|nr:hypothetical protein [Lachnoclostridium pacaense]